MRMNRNIADVLFWLGLGFIAFGLSEAKSAELATTNPPTVEIQINIKVTP